MNQDHPQPFHLEKERFEAALKAMARIEFNKISQQHTAKLHTSIYVLFAHNRPVSVSTTPFKLPEYGDKASLYQAHYPAPNPPRISSNTATAEDCLHCQNQGGSLIGCHFLCDEYQTKTTTEAKS